ncbi:MAG: tetratricopeptide repeat protein [Verrucomicrobiota bacterium]
MKGSQQMRWLMCVMAVLAGTARTALAAVAAGRVIPAAKLQQTFLEAGRAYDAGRLPDAIGLYEKLLTEGYVSKELLFNLGNAYFREGKAGRAVLHYRRAWQLAPRDPDILANFGFAQQSTGATPPSLPAVSRALLRFCRTEWIIAALVSYWLGAVALCLFILFPARRPVFLRAVAVLGVLLVTSLAGLVQWISLCRNPELVVVGPGQEARFAPLEGSTAHFALPEGSIVRETESSGPWVKVASGKQSGWIRRSACLPVCTWQNAKNGLILKGD